MKRYLLSIVLMTMFLSPAALSQEAEPLEQMQLQMQQRNMEMEMEEREVEAKFHHEMRKLELEERRAHLEGQRRAHGHHKKPLCPLLIVICVIVHILVAIWVFQDIRQRSCGSGIWIVVALLAGLFGVIAYAIVRLSDNAKEKA